MHKTERSFTLSLIAAALLAAGLHQPTQALITGAGRSQPGSGTPVSSVSTAVGITASPINQAQAGAAGSHRRAATIPGPSAKSMPSMASKLSGAVARFAQAALDRMTGNEPAPPCASAPRPLPMLELGAAFSHSRRLKKRIQSGPAQLLRLAARRSRPSRPDQQSADHPQQT